VLIDAVLRTTRPARDALPVSRTTRSTRLRSAQLHAFHAPRPPLGVTRKARARSPRPVYRFLVNVYIYYTEHQYNVRLIQILLYSIRISLLNLGCIS